MAGIEPAGNTERERDSRSRGNGNGHNGGGPVNVFPRAPFTPTRLQGSGYVLRDYVPTGDDVEDAIDRWRRIEPEDYEYE